MPIDISNMSDVEKLIANVDEITPKTFNSDLTGNEKRKTGLFNKDRHTLADIVEDKDSSFMTFGGQATTNVNEFHESLSCLINLSPNNILGYNTSHAARNRVSITGLPFPYEWPTPGDQKDADRATPFSAELDHPLYAFGCDDLDKNFTHLKDIHDFHVYGRFLINTVHTFTYKDSVTKKDLRPYKLQLNPTPLFIYTKSDDTDVMQSSTYFTNRALTVDEIEDQLQTYDVVASYMPNFIDFSTCENADTVFDHDIKENYWMSLRDYIPQGNSSDVDKIGDHSLYLDLAHQCEALPQSLIEDTIMLVNAAAQNIKDDLIANNYIKMLIASTGQIATKLQSYLTSADYTRLSNTIKSYSNRTGINIPDILSLDLRLLLADRLDKLEELKNQHQLHQFTPKKSAVNHQWTLNPNYSNQQKKLIRTTEPLVVGTAGAGSGKTHTITGRLDYLEQQDEDLSKCLTLSFTNTAVDNLKQRYPKIQSKTMASLFDDIYKENFPDQYLSNTNTLVNVLRQLNIRSKSYFTQNKQGLDINDLVDAQDALIKSLSLKTNAMSPFARIDERTVIVSLLNTINSYLDEIMFILDALNQTTLEIEPIVIYCMLLKNRKLKIPKQYHDLTHIIADESQDISTFEYILLLDLTIMYKSNLMIIGDGSQTLYEFRNANPMFMNTLESSNAFKTYHLTTNYRSNKSILTYANEFLNIIDANKYAKIQLQPNMFEQLSDKTFTDTIKLRDIPLDHMRGQAYEEDLNDAIAQDTSFANWLVDKFNKGEKIACIAYKRKDAEILESNIKSIIQTRCHQIVDPLRLTPARTMMDSNLTEALFTCNQNHKFNHIPLNAQFMIGYTNAIEQAILDNQSHRHVKKPFIPGYIVDKLASLRKNQYIKSYLIQVINHQKPLNLLLGTLQQMLIQEEVRYNSIRQQQLSDKHRKEIDERMKDAQIIISTIHSVKGLEFDNTIVYCPEPNQLTQEEARMYMVALTRAKSHEFIINTYAQTQDSKRTKHENVSTDQLDMFHTPMVTAYQRVLDNITKP